MNRTPALVVLESGSMPFVSEDWGHRFMLDRGIESLIDETQKHFEKDKLRLTGVDVYEL